MKIESSEFEHGRVYFKQFDAKRVKHLMVKRSFDVSRISFKLEYSKY